MGYSEYLENNLNGFWDFYHGMEGGAGSGKARQAYFSSLLCSILH
jgi:hypothetical protein